MNPEKSNESSNILDSLIKLVKPMSSPGNLGAQFVDSLLQGIRMDKVETDPTTGVKYKQNEDGTFEFFEEM